MTRWFAEVFLPSIFERCEPGKGKWLSQKQTAICIDNMHRSTVRFDSDGYGTMWNHDNYTCEWNGRNVHLSYSKKNGCGCIDFGFNSEEIATINAEHEAERHRIKAERIERIKRNPERLTKRIDSIERKISALQKEWEAEKEEPDFDETDAEYYTKEIAKLEAELALYKDGE